MRTSIIDKRGNSGHQGYQNVKYTLRISPAAAAAKSLQSCPTLCDPRDGSPPGSPVLGFSRQEHWSGLHFLLQCMKVKSESEVTQSCHTPSDPMDCSLPGSSIHGVCQARVLEWGTIAFSPEYHQIMLKGKFYSSTKC